MSKFKGLLHNIEVKLGLCREEIMDLSKWRHRVNQRLGGKFKEEQGDDEEEEECDEKMGPDEAEDGEEEAVVEADDVVDVETDDGTFQ